MVEVVYHPADPGDLERQYPGHLQHPGVPALLGAASAVYAGPIGGEVAGKKITRSVIFVFPDEATWERVSSSGDGAAAVQDAARIAGPNGMSVLAGDIQISKP